MGSWVALGSLVTMGSPLAMGSLVALGSLVAPGSLLAQGSPLARWSLLALESLVTMGSLLAPRSPLSSRCPHGRGAGLGVRGRRRHGPHAGRPQVFPTLLGDVDSAGSLNAQALHLLGERLRAKAPSPVIVVAHFLQSVTARLVLGGELVYHRRPGEEGAILTLAGKYSAPNWVSTLNLGYGGAHASYYHRATSRAPGQQLERGGGPGEEVAPLPVTLALGAFLNHWRNRFHCGFSVTVG
ncbi:hypothetical protein DUI87_35365 [Hirundo rustica rustica]|uniref:Uncharacterized protein n=1 Tax=Hirundo rustica rustica TaxID=333673 RepID=A0A3M0IMP9_HIRRU|nr:hypothetical protein DUI87_35365 [Hirundo rustica rustica]